MASKKVHVENVDAGETREGDHGMILALGQKEAYVGHN